MRRRRRALALALAVALLGAGALAPGALAAPAPRTSLSDVEDEVMCVVCGVPLQVAESPQAERERALIRGLIARGYTKRQVEDELVAQYGPRVLATPGHHGFEAAVWVVPIAVVLALLAALALVVPRWRRRAGAGGEGLLGRAGPGAPGPATAGATATASPRATAGAPATVGAPAGPGPLTPADARRLDEDLARYEP